MFDVSAKLTQSERNLTPTQRVALLKRPERMPRLGKSKFKGKKRKAANRLANRPVEQGKLSPDGELLAAVEQAGLSPDGELLAFVDRLCDEQLELRRNIDALNDHIDDLYLVIAECDSDIAALALPTDAKLKLVVRQFLDVRHARYPGVHADLTALLETMNELTADGSVVDNKSEAS